MQVSFLYLILPSMAHFKLFLVVSRPYILYVLFHTASYSRQTLSIIWFSCNGSKWCGDMSFGSSVKKTEYNPAGVAQ